jgi:hypothetical protein
MSECRSPNEARPLESAARCNTIHGRSLPGFLLIAVLCSADALADDHPSNHVAPPQSTAPVNRQSSPPAAAAIPGADMFALPKSTGVPAFSATDFRPRKPTVFERDSLPGASTDTTMLESTTVWQQMSEYRSQDRLRLLTLWESSGSAVSLQTGRHGGPSLQWNSRFMNHDGSTRGVFDRLLSLSLSGAHNAARNAPPAAGAPPTPKPPATAAVAGLN